MSRFEPGYSAPTADPLPGPDYSDYDPDDETVLTVRDAADRDAATTDDADAADDAHMNHEHHEEGSTDGR
jgi:hypothetical protein